MTRRSAVLIVALLVVVGAVVHAAFPRPTGYVNDFANLLDASARAEIEAALRDAETRTAAEIVIATVPSLDGMSVEEYANKMFADWGVGKKKADNGVLVVIAPSDRSMRIEVGYGLEGILPDGLAGEIIRTEFTPRFKQDDYPGGIRAGMARIVSVVEAKHVLTPEEVAALRDSSSEDPPLWIIIPFFGIFITIGSLAIGAGVQSKTVGPILFGGMFTGIPSLMSILIAPWATLFVLGPLAVFMLIVGYRKGAKTLWANGAGGSGGGWTMGGSGGSSGSSDGGGWSSGGSSGGSFGGGSSGGGGASGRW